MATGMKRTISWRNLSEPMEKDMQGQSTEGVAEVQVFKREAKLMIKSGEVISMFKEEEDVA
jgi:hypothetical protein